MHPHWKQLHPLCSWSGFGPGNNYKNQHACHAQFCWYQTTFVQQKSNTPVLVTKYLQQSQGYNLNANLCYINKSFQTNHKVHFQVGLG
jgi:hypothetical protein